MSTILLVEDEPDSAFLFKHVVKKLGITHPVQVATDGQEALDYLHGVGKFADRLVFPRPSLIVLDLKLPRVNGLEVLRQIRANPGLRSLIVIMLTSSASDDDIAKAYDLGVNGYLVKPSELSELTKMLQSIHDFWLTHNRHAQ